LHRLTAALPAPRLAAVKLSRVSESKTREIQSQSRQLSDGCDRYSSIMKLG
jgi:hypothetical protein